eukprot:935965-Pyramimonas_sp.AAC.1
MEVRTVAPTSRWKSAPEVRTSRWKFAPEARTSRWKFAPSGSRLGRSFSSLHSTAVCLEGKAQPHEWKHWSLSSSPTVSECQEP